MPILNCIYSLCAYFATKVFTQIGLMSKSILYYLLNQRVIYLAKCYHWHKLYLIGFYQGKLQQSKVTKKTITHYNSKTNKKQNKMNLSHMICCYTQIEVLNVNITLLTSISSLAFNTEQFMEQFFQHLLNGTFRIFFACSISMPFQHHFNAMGMVKHQIRV